MLVLPVMGQRASLLPSRDLDLHLVVLPHHIPKSPSRQQLFAAASSFR